ncbi:hypothetical protein O1R50_02905 [Glycomyces luteolus]|uniref:Uncharacterized protein n=1 Tax=Glycomyces luteolus TaxID=2670330 RepID=A0A9X3P7W4_9ACTN|nr:hypothetical protein [Glycomyces luteolus]MDA1358553.1 hypothetical protein [Glycomyces luteolus]
MSDDIEGLLRSGLAERAEAAPSFDDPGLADLAIAGAGRIRRRRRVAAAAGGAGLIVLGAATFAWNPLIGHDRGDGNLTAADTSTVEVQNEFAMEFLIQEEDGSYNVLDQNGNTISFGVDEPIGNVYKLQSSYFSEAVSDVWTVSFDGDATAWEKPSADETYTRISSAGDRFAMITPNSDYSAEDYELLDVSLHEEAATETVGFTTNYAVTLEDWDATTAVFTTDLNSATGGSAGAYWFNDNLSLGLETVSAAGFEAAVLVDTTDPNNVCVSDLDAVGTASEREQCGPADSAEIRAQMVAAAGGEAAADPVPLVDTVITKSQAEFEFAPIEDVDFGVYQERYENAGEFWTDPGGAWQIVGNRGEDTWLLIDASGEEPVVSELEPPEGAVMPILSYT